MPAPRRSFDELLASRVLERFVEYRRRLAPGMSVLALLFIALDPTPLRIACFVVPATLINILAAWEGHLARRGELSAKREQLTVLLTGLLQIAFVFAAGGIASPVTPILPVFALIVSVTLEARLSAALVLGIQLPAVWTLVLVHHLGVVPSLVPPAYDGLYVDPGTPGTGPLLGGTFLSVALAVGMVSGRTIRRVIVELAEESSDERARTLEQHGEAARAMAALSGEIAHELKNPLASIKGLAALVRRDLEGRSAERLDVLRAEVERMQTIVEDFLAHARPLVPLAIEEADVAELAREVVAMHEGVAAERNVGLVTRGTQARLRCDPRKVRQIAINLVQNALDASARGATVEMEVARTEGGGVCLRVRDHGAGLDAGVRDKLFQVGATTKPRGTGLGLVVARGLARQHGGELTLESADGGGCVAELTLPGAPTLREAPSGEAHVAVAG